MEWSDMALEFISPFPMRGDVEHRINQMRDELALGQDNKDKQIGVLLEEIVALKLRLGVVVRLLIAKNLLTAQEIASLIAAAEAKLDPRRTTGA